MEEGPVARKTKKATSKNGSLKEEQVSATSRNTLAKIRDELRRKSATFDRELAAEVRAELTAEQLQRDWDDMRGKRRTRSRTHHTRRAKY